MRPHTKIPPFGARFWLDRPNRPRAPLDYRYIIRRVQIVRHILAVEGAADVEALAGIQDYPVGPNLEASRDHQVVGIAKRGLQEGFGRDGDGIDVGAVKFVEAARERRDYPYPFPVVRELKIRREGVSVARTGD